MRMIKSAAVGFYMVVALFLTGFQGCSVPEVPDVIPPIVVVIHPAPGQVLTGEVPVVASSTDDDDVESMTLYIDGIQVASQKGNNLTYNWNTTPIADNRDHYIMALARDQSGNTGFSPLVRVRVVKGSQPDTLAPVITILHPVTGQVVRDTINVITQVKDQSAISKVEFYIDGNLEYTDLAAPFQYEWVVTSLVNGSLHSIFATAYDENGYIGVSPTITVTVASDVVEDITPPTLTILYPPAGATFSVATTSSITIVADAEDESGIDRVEFYIDGALKATDASKPYEYSWNLTTYADGNAHTIYVKAYDKAGNFNAAMNVVTILP